jgi:photosystem I P700 chlorophyll a apoprotein A1
MLTLVEISKVFKLLQGSSKFGAEGVTTQQQLYCIALGGLVMSGLMLFAGWFHYHKAAPKLEWFQNAESMLNHHLSVLLGLGSLSWAGHQIHIGNPINKLLDSGMDPKIYQIHMNY